MSCWATITDKSAVHRWHLLDITLRAVSCGMFLHSSVRLRPPQALKGVNRPDGPIYSLPFVGLIIASIEFTSGEWAGQVSMDSLDVALLQKLIDNSTAMRMCFIVPGEGVWMLSHRWHSDGLENVIDALFRIQVCPPQVWLNLWTTWPWEIFDTPSVASKQLWTTLIYCCGHMKQFSNSSHTFSRLQVPNQAQSCSFNQLCFLLKKDHCVSLIVCFHNVERHLHINGKLSVFATFTFAHWKRQM